MSVGDVSSQADEWARALLDPSMTETARRQQLSAIRTSNETLHALVIKKLDQYRSQAGTLGREAGLQQMGIGQAKTAFSEKITGLMIHVHQMFPLTKTAGQQHTIKRLDDSRYELSIFHKNAGHSIEIKESELDGSLLNLVADIKAAIQ
jgi:hypothetical protein